jgi:hypothetical protein
MLGRRLFLGALLAVSLESIRGAEVERRLEIKTVGFAGWGGMGRI